MRLRCRTHPHTRTNRMSTPAPAATAADGAGALLRAAVRAASTGNVPRTASAGGQPVRNASRMPATSGGSKLHASPPVAPGAPATTLTTAPATEPSAAGITQAAAIGIAAFDGP